MCVEDIMKQLDLLQDYSLHIPKRDSKDLCVIQFSSGSTGAPKGVMLSFNNILTNLKIKTLADEITTEDTLIHWMPYFHDYGLFGNHLVCLYNQITEIKIEPFSFLRDPLIFLKKISEYQVSICGGTTPSGLDLLIQKLEQSNDIKELDLSQVKTLSIGAEMVPSNLYVRLSPLFQLGFNRNAFRPSYGMAETTLIVSSCLPGYGNKNIRINREAFYEGIIKLVDKQQDFCEFVSAGRILPGLQVRIVKDGIPQNVIDHEFEIGREKAREEGKPENMLDKIAQGRLNKFFQESTLLNQVFEQDGKMSVREYLKSVDKDLTVTAFLRFTLNA